LPRVLGPVKQIMGDDIYLYQSRLNYKRARTGDVFQWHQDYQSWLMDGVPNAYEGFWVRKSVANPGVRRANYLGCLIEGSR
jgi:Phytanoyl-CoA dioxygenase (PhyH)